MGSRKVSLRGNVWAQTRVLRNSCKYLGERCPRKRSNKRKCLNVRQPSWPPIYCHNLATPCPLILTHLYYSTFFLIKDSSLFKCYAFYIFVFLIVDYLSFPYWDKFPEVRRIYVLFIGVSPTLRIVSSARTLFEWMHERVNTNWLGTGIRKMWREHHPCREVRYDMN